MITITKLLDGPEHVIIHVYVLGEGDELTDEVLIDPALLSPPTQRLGVEEVSYDWAGFDATIQFKSGVIGQTMIWVLAERSNGDRCFKPWGNLPDRSGVDGDGKLLFSTIGLESGEQGTMLIKARKNVRQLTPDEL